MGAGPAGPGRKARRSCAAAYNALMPTATVPGAAAPWPPAAPAAPLAVLVSGGARRAVPPRGAGAGVPPGLALLLPAGPLRDAAGVGRPAAVPGRRRAPAARAP